MRRRLVEAAPAAALAVLLTAVLASNLAWVRSDEQQLPGTDAYSYMAGLLELSNSFPWAGPWELRSALNHLSHAGRPPLYQLAAAPFVALFGGTEDSFVLASLLALVALALATAALARRAAGGLTGAGAGVGAGAGGAAAGRAGAWAGVLAAAVVVSYPPVIHLGHTFLPHLGAAAAAAWTLALLAGLLVERSAARARWLGVSLGVGMMIHPSYLWAVAVPVAGAGLWLLADPAGERGGGPAVASAAGSPGAAGRLPPLGSWAGLAARIRHPLVLRGLLPGALAAVLLVAPWYATFGQRLLVMQSRLTSEELAAHRGFEQMAVSFHRLEPGFWWYAETAPRVLGWPLAALLLLGAAAALVRRTPAGWLLLAAVGSTYALLATQPTLSWVYPGVGLPAAAALTAYGIAALRPRPLALVAATVALAAAALAQVYVPWRGGPSTALLAEAAGAADLRESTCRQTRAFCPAPPGRRPLPVAAALEQVLEDPRCAGEEPCLLMVIQGAGIDRTLFRYELARRWPGRRLELRSQLESAWGSQFPLDTLLAADYVFYVDRDVPPASEGRRFKWAATRLLRHPPAVFANRHRRAARLKLADGGSAVLLRRVRPMTVSEIDATADALELDPRYKFERYLVLGRLHARHRRRDRLARLLDEARATAPEALGTDNVIRQLEYLLFHLDRELEEAAPTVPEPPP